MSVQKILILGITSNVGYRMNLLNQKYDVYGICRKWPLENKNNIFEFDKVEISVIESVVNSIEPDIIINCINMADVDECEVDRLSAYNINYKLCINIADLCKKHAIKSINFSSSLVYGGSNVPYNEDSIFSPINEYGKIKQKTDSYLRSFLSNGILIRPTTIVGKKEFFQRENPVSIISKKILNDENVLLVEDVSTNILFLDDLVHILFILIDDNINGEFNVGGLESVSRYELGCKLHESLPKQVATLQKCRSEDFKTIAERPKIVVLDNTKLLSKVSFRFTSLNDFIKNIYDEMDLV